MKCDPPTPAMPTMATGATVPGLYSHIAHSVDKKRVKYLKHLKAQNQNKPEVEENLKAKLRNKDRTHQKPKRQMKLTDTKTLTITITMPQARVRPAVTDNFEGLHNEIEAKDFSIVSVSFKIITIREAHHNKTILNMATVLNPIFRGIMPILIEAGAVAMDLGISEDVVMVATNYQNNNGMNQYQYYTHDQQSEQYGPPCSLCGRFNHPPKDCYKGEHDMNNIMEKMSINPHPSQQNNLYQ